MKLKLIEVEYRFFQKNVQTVLAKKETKIHVIPNIGDVLYYAGARYKDSYISFGYSDVRDNVKYILEDMKRVIEGDFSNVLGAGIYKRDISNLK